MFEIVVKVKALYFEITAAGIVFYSWFQYYLIR